MSSFSSILSGNIKPALLGSDKFKKTFLNLHNPLKKNDIFSNDYRRLAFDEIFSNLLMLLKARKIIKIKKEENKKYSEQIERKILNNFPYKLTEGQKKIMKELKRFYKSVQN